MSTLIQTRLETRPGPALLALRSHWPEYLIEAGALAAFMISACLFTVLLEHPFSPVRQTISDGFSRRALAGLAMGLTAVAIIYSPWGRRSGAHMNPAFTLAFLSLGKIERWDAIFYVGFQFAGGLTGVLLSWLAAGGALGHAAVNFAVTVPGGQGAGAAFWAELFLSALLMLGVLVFSNRKRLNRYTGLMAGTMVALFITFEAPLSGMSINPARTFGSALPARTWTDVWIYFTAPLLGMLLAGALYGAIAGARRVHCAKLHHENDKRCIFRCHYGAIDDQQSSL